MTRLITLPDQAAQRRMLPAVPSLDECYKELLCWGAPLNSWDVSKRHAQLDITDPTMTPAEMAETNGIYSGARMVPDPHELEVPESSSDDGENEDDETAAARVRLRAERIRLAYLLGRVLTNLARRMHVPWLHTTAPARPPNRCPATIVQPLARPLVKASSLQRSHFPSPVARTVCGSGSAAMHSVRRPLRRRCVPG